MTLALRVDQGREGALGAIEKAWTAGCRRQLVSYPTGCGKTVIFSNLPSIGFRRLLVVAHREELLDQAADKLRTWNPGLTVQVDQADRWADLESLAAFDGELFSSTGYAVCASVATIGRAGSRRLTRYPAGLFDAVVIDEAHHSTAQSYSTVIDHFGAGEPGGPLLVGFTATPFRGDGADLSKRFQKLVYSLELPDAITRGYLVDIRAFSVPTGVDLDGVGATREDFKVGELADAVNTTSRNGRVVKAYLDHAADRKAIVFAADVAHSKNLTEAFLAAGVAARHVDGTTPADERAAIFAWLREPGPKTLTNVGIACLDEKSEILTSSGWVGCDAITKDHAVANWEDGRIRFAPPLAIEVRERRPGERMVVLETKNRSIRVTEDHRMLYRTLQGGAFRVARASSLVGRAAELPIFGEALPWNVVPQQAAAARSPQRRRIQANAYTLRKAGMTDAAATAEATRRVKLRDELGYAAPASLTEAECEFIGFWLGDGTRQALQSGGVEYLLWQGQSHPGLCTWVDGLIERIGVDVVRRILPPRRPGGHHVVEWSLCRGTGFGPQRRRGLYRLEPYLTKAGSPLLWGLDGAQFAALLRGFWMADGEHGQATEPASDGWRIGNTNRGLLDLLQAIAVCRGFRANITDGRTNTKKGYKPLWRLSVSRRVSHAMTKFRLRFEDDPWRAERVWCVKVDSGFIVTRRRGTVTVTGNTEGFDEPSVSCVILARPTKSRVLFCFDEETEVLTPNGWVKGRTVREGDPIAAFRPGDGSVRWEPVLATVERPLLAGERMMELRTPAIDIRVTDTHRMVWRHRAGRARTRTPWTVTTAGELAQRAGEWELPVAGLEDAPGIPLSDDELRLIGWVQTDGCFNRSNKSIVISQSRGALSAEVERVLSACGMRWSKSVRTDRTAYGPRRVPLHVYVVSVGQWRRLAAWIPKVDEKAWGRLEQMDARQWGVLLSAWHDGDGSKQVGQSWTRRGYHLAIGDEWTAGWVQGMCMRRGWRANVAKQASVYMVHCRRGVARHVSGATAVDRHRLVPSIERPGEKVWCVSVHSGAILTRRNGKGAVVGQTQMIGRGTRLCAGKVDLLVIDLVDVSSKHTLANAAALFGLPAGLDLGGTSTTKARARVKELVQEGLPFEELSKAKTLADLDAIVNEYRRVGLFWQPKTAPEVAGISSLGWVSVGDGAIALRAGELRAWVTTDMLGHAHLVIRRAVGLGACHSCGGAPRADLVPAGNGYGACAAYRCICGQSSGVHPTEAEARSAWNLKMKDPGQRREVLELAADFQTLAEAVREADARLSADQPRVFTDPKARWRRDPASEKQLDLLRKFRVPFRQPLTKGEAGILLDKAFARRGIAARRAS